MLHAQMMMCIPYHMFLDTCVAYVCLCFHAVCLTQKLTYGTLQKNFFSFAKVREQFTKVHLHVTL